MMDLIGKESPKIGPDKLRDGKLANMQPSKTQKEVRSFLGLVIQLGRYCSNYTMITTNMRGLIQTNVKFDSSVHHQLEF